MPVFLKLSYFSAVSGVGDSFFIGHYGTGTLGIPVLIMSYWFMKRGGHARTEL